MRAETTKNKEKAFDPVKVMVKAGLSKKEAEEYQQHMAEWVKETIAKHETSAATHADLEILELRVKNQFDSVKRDVQDVRKDVKSLKRELENKIEEQGKRLDTKIDNKIDSLKKDLIIKLGGLTVTTMAVLSAIIGVLSNLDKIFH